MPSVSAATSLSRSATKARPIRDRNDSQAKMSRPRLTSQLR